MSNLRLLVAIPCLNEEKTIRQVLGQIPASFPGIGSITKLVIDDGSTDATITEAKAGGAIVVSHFTNRGVGASFQSATKFAIEQAFDIMVNIDGDGQFSPEDIPKLVN